MNPLEFETAQAASPLNWPETCPSCSFSFTNSMDKEAIRDWGKCLRCDKLDLSIKEPIEV